MASEAAKAISQLLEFSGEDQQGLLEVLKDYFIQPEDSTDQHDSDEDDDADDAILGGKT